MSMPSSSSSTATGPVWRFGVTPTTTAAGQAAIDYDDVAYIGGRSGLGPTPEAGREGEEHVMADAFCLRRRHGRIHPGCGPGPGVGGRRDARRRWSGLGLMPAGRTYAAAWPTGPPPRRGAHSQARSSCRAWTAATGPRRRNDLPRTAPACHGIVPRRKECATQLAGCGGLEGREGRPGPRADRARRGPERPGVQWAGDLEPRSTAAEKFGPSVPSRVEVEPVLAMVSADAPGRLPV